MIFFWIAVFLLLCMSLLMSLLVIAGVMAGKGEPLPPPPRSQLPAEPAESHAPSQDVAKGAPRKTGVG